MRARRVAVCIGQGLLMVLPQSVRAQQEPSTPERAAAPDSRVRARQRFDRGVELAKTEDFTAAIAAFEDAYALSPHYSVLYYLAQANMALGRPVEAVQAFERYLKEGGARIDSERRAQVEQSMSALQRRIGFVELMIEPKGVEVLVDGRSVGTSPFGERLPLSSGTHGLVARAPGSTSHFESIEITAGQTTPIALKLPLGPATATASGLLLPDCDVAAAVVEVDGVRRPLAPHGPTLLLPAGPHRVRFVRRGYTAPEQSVVVHPDRVVTLRCGLVPLAPSPSESGWLIPVVTPADARVHVDGRIHTGARLPTGPHRVRLSHSRYREWAETVTIAPGQRRVLVVKLTPTPEYSSELEAAARQRRTWTIGLGAASLALIGTAIGTYLWNGQRFDDWRDDRAEVDARLSSGETSRETLAQNANLRERLAGLQRMDAIAVGLGIAGIVGAGATTALWFDGRVHE